MSAPSRHVDRPWEPEALELPLEMPRRGPRVSPSQVTVPSSDGEPAPAPGGERAGSYVVVIDIA
jgi:hypothetical protein